MYLVNICLKSEGLCELDLQQSRGLGLAGRILFLARVDSTRLACSSTWAHQIPLLHEKGGLIFQTLAVRRDIRKTHRHIAPPGWLSDPDNFSTLASAAIETSISLRRQQSKSYPMPRHTWQPSQRRCKLFRMRHTSLEAISGPGGLRPIFLSC